jgi:hypothetical protein
VKQLITLRSALEDPMLLGDALTGDSWFCWRTLLIAAMGEPLVSSAERDAFSRLTGGREHVAGEMAETVLAVAGRRSGKTKATATLTVYLSTLCDWSADLSLGERGIATFLAPSERQALTAWRYTAAIVDHVPLLASLVVSRTADTLTLKNGVDIEVMAASWRNVRGSTSIAVVLDEVAFLRSEGANTDVDLITALRPSLATTGGPMLLTSSPADMQGVVYATHKRHFGPAGDARVLVLQSDTRTLNPSLSQRVIDRAIEDDPVAAESEYGGRFRTSLTAYLQRSTIERATAPGVIERPFVKGRSYTAFADVAGGSGRDSYTLAVGHNEYRDGREVAVLDLLVEKRPPFNPDEVTAHCAELLRAFGLLHVIGDAYGGDWPKTAFGRCGIEYRLAHATKSEVYLHVAPLFAGGRVELLDLPRLMDQLCGLQRKAGAGGRESVDHPRGGHDDLSNAACGVLWRLSPSRGRVALVGAIAVTGVTSYFGDHPGNPSVPAMSPSPVMVEHPAAGVADAASVMAAISPLCTPAPGLPPFADVYKTDWPVW